MLEGGGKKRGGREGEEAKLGGGGRELFIIQRGSSKQHQKYSLSAAGGSGALQCSLCGGTLSLAAPPGMGGKEKEGTVGSWAEGQGDVP